MISAGPPSPARASVRVVAKETRDELETFGGLRVPRLDGDAGGIGAGVLARRRRNRRAGVPPLLQGVRRAFALFRAYPNNPRAATTVGSDGTCFPRSSE